MPPTSASLTRTHLRRLRETYRSAGWPVQDVIEVELLAAGLLERIPSTLGPETLRVTDAGITCIAQSAQSNRQALSAHEALVHRIAETLLRDGRIVWTQLSVRARLPDSVDHDGDAPPAPRWKVCKPDVFSIRNTTVAGYLEPTVHEIKVNRADLLGDLKHQDKRDSYLDVGGQCWYVLGCDHKGQPIAEPDEIPDACGVLIAQPDHLVVARPAPMRAVVDLPFALWMALAKSAPLPSLTYFSDEASQAPLALVPPVIDSDGLDR
jgi:hypothetical protein